MGYVLLQRPESSLSYQNRDHVSADSWRAVTPVTMVTKGHRYGARTFSQTNHERKYKALQQVLADISGKGRKLDRRI